MLWRSCQTRFQGPFRRRQKIDGFSNNKRSNGSNTHRLKSAILISRASRSEVRCLRGLRLRRHCDVAATSQSESRIPAWPTVPIGLVMPERSRRLNLGSVQQLVVRPWAQVAARAGLLRSDPVSVGSQAICIPLTRARPAGSDGPSNYPDYVKGTKAEFQRY